MRLFKCKMVWHISILAAMFLVALFPGGMQASAAAMPSNVAPEEPALWTPGLQLYGKGGKVEVTLLGGYAGFENHLYLMYYVTSPGSTPILLGTNRDRDKGKEINVGVRNSTTELIFYIEAYLTDANGDPLRDANGVLAKYGTFYTGPGNRPGATNADGLAHAAVKDLGSGAALVGFEDTYGYDLNCDWDFNDLIFGVTGIKVVRNGFVTAGGYGDITWPGGSYPTDPAITGTANFGFNAKYKSNGTLQGSVEYNARPIDLNFHSTRLDWLTVSAPMFIIRGSGTINGAGDYLFFLIGYDSGAGGTGKDKLRMKISDKSSGNVVYDNQMGTPLGVVTADIINGSITIHQ
ncbi:MAG: DUF4114 domain-containing protein [Chloroflexi bacterium]|nr:DUF4114 domain-containing protein [Chloroflexota bacterium]